MCKSETPIQAEQLPHLLSSIELVFIFFHLAWPILHWIHRFLFPAHQAGRPEHPVLPGFFSFEREQLELSAYSSPQ